jgi:hypothetical protein
VTPKRSKSWVKNCDHTQLNLENAKGQVNRPLALPGFPPRRGQGWVSVKPPSGSPNPKRCSRDWGARPPRAQWTAPSRSMGGAGNDSPPAVSRRLRVRRGARRTAAGAAAIPIHFHVIVPPHPTFAHPRPVRWGIGQGDGLLDY